MKLTKRDKYVLFESFYVLAWLGILCWTSFYSFWLTLAVAIYVTLDRTVFRKFWYPQNLSPTAGHLSENKRDA